MLNDKIIEYLLKRAAVTKNARSPIVTTLGLAEDAAGTAAQLTRKFLRSEADEALGGVATLGRLGPEVGETLDTVEDVVSLARNRRIGQTAEEMLVNTSPRLQSGGGARKPPKSPNTGAPAPGDLPPRQNPKGNSGKTISKQRDVAASPDPEPPLKQRDVAASPDPEPPLKQQTKNKPASGEFEPTRTGGGWWGGIKRWIPGALAGGGVSAYFLGKDDIQEAVTNNVIPLINRQMNDWISTLTAQHGGEIARQVVIKKLTELLPGILLGAAVGGGIPALTAPKGRPASFAALLLGSIIGSLVGGGAQFLLVPPANLPQQPAQQPAQQAGQQKPQQPPQQPAQQPAQQAGQQKPQQPPQQPPAQPVRRPVVPPHMPV